jgi:hypothetical protein
VQLVSSVDARSSGVLLARRGLAEISRIVADFSASMVPSAMCESASMRTEFAMCFVKKRGTPVA